MRFPRLSAKARLRPTHSLPIMRAHMIAPGLGAAHLRRRQFCMSCLCSNLYLLMLSAAASAQLVVGSGSAVVCVFAGDGRQVPVQLHNAGAGPVAAHLHTLLYQATLAIAAPLGEAPWKKLTVLPGQTVLETATLSLPPVRAETRFVVQWLEGTNKVVGTTEVLAYPADLLKELKPLLGDEPLGVFDPQNHLKPLLKAAGVECQDLEDAGLEDCRGRLAIIGPFQSRAQMRESLAHRSVKALAAKGVAAVWIQPPPEKGQDLKPSFYLVPEGKGAVVIVQAELLVNLAESPQAQLNLVRFARFALHPEPLQLPDLTPSP
jgi:hypothetical protein